MLSGLLFVISPLIIGYLVKTSNQDFLLLVDKTCQRLVMIILALMGLSLAKMDELGQNLTQILYITGIFFICISLCNLVSLPILDKLWKTDSKGEKAAIPLKKVIFDSAKLIMTILIGLCVGLLIHHFFINGLNWVDVASEWVLFLLLILVGVSLRNSALPIKQMLLNTHGIILAVWVLVSSLCGGLLAAYWLNIPVNYGLAMASGFGWYSLTGILITDHLGAIYGSAAFLNELLRELIALILIPVFIARYPSTAIGYAGATAMDFTLPVIQQTGGNRCVPTAIISGFILSMLVPILVALFASL